MTSTDRFREAVAFVPAWHRCHPSICTNPRCPVGRFQGQSDGEFRSWLWNARLVRAAEKRADSSPPTLTAAERYQRAEAKAAEIAARLAPVASMNDAPELSGQWNQQIFGDHARSR